MGTGAVVSISIFKKKVPLLSCSVVEMGRILRLDRRMQLLDAYTISKSQYRIDS